MGRKRADGWPEGVEPRDRSIRIGFEYLGERRRETLRIPPTPANKKFAERKRAQILLEIEKGIFDYGLHFPGSVAFKRKLSAGTTVHQACKTWLKGRVQRAYTMEVNESYLKRHIGKHPIGKRPIGTVQGSELELLRAELAKKLSAKTVNNILILVRGGFELAHDDGVIARNPAGRLKNIRLVRKSDADPFEAAELRAIDQEIDEAQIKNLVETWWNTGFREGELFGLEWPDVDWIRRRAHVQRSVVKGKEQPPKDNEERFVDLPPRAIAALTRQKAHTLLVGGKVFINPTTQKPWTSTERFARRMKRWCKRAGVRYRPPKQLRHTYASMALSAGEAPLYVMHQLGHASLQMLQDHYAKWMAGARPDTGKGFEKAAAAV